ncbi:UDP-N-acetylmuramate dehydrogenase [uncultured Dysosmobacter sp.]|uniref:UDP-N-acetylmuramate dehydrogenase n=1 Tax=uncultured Dysosmobacter sp. TaxID=2591384 RepID=UPI002621EBA1|nr:UDP-N-acetylmuramate dehydrogenase [uncultured Dysosmobacter sp.]
MDWYTELDKRIAAYLPDLKVTADEPMSRHTSFRIGGPARRMAFPQNGEQLVLLMGFAEECGAETLVIGNGTNLLAADEGLDRLVVDLSAAMHGIQGEENGTVTAEAGVSLARLADFACKQGLTGLEFAHGIPGTLGGAVCMNAGAYGGEMKQVIQAVTVLFPDEGVKTLTGEEMAFGYRCSLLTDRPEGVVLRAAVRLAPGDPAAIREKMQELMARRKASQPLEWPSAGSTFKRPAGHFAGTLIDQCGLKGLTVGGAQVSEKHAGFVINKGGATCADVTALIAQVQARVYDKTGVRLEPEVKIIR